VTRIALTLFLFAGLSAWAGAQTANPRNAADDLRLLQKNMALLEELIDQSVKVGDSTNTLERIEECRKATITLRIALRDAAESSDADRVVELSGHLTTIVSDGLAYNLDEAQRTIPPGSPDFPRLQAARKQALEELTRAQQVFPTTGKLAESPQVIAAQQKMAEAGRRMAGSK
jgi:hypothetical protein